MLIPAAFPANQVGHDALARLITIRWLLVAIESAMLLGLNWGLGVVLDGPILMLVLVLHAGLNLIARWRLNAANEAPPHEVLLFLLADAEAIAALIYCTGGYANPFISLLLVPLILCAVSLPTRHAWGMTLWVAVLYSLLARFYQPLVLPVSGQSAIDLHLAGMWLNFLLTAGLVAAFISRLAHALGQRERDLARIREQALRDEQLFELGMQAAAAAHDLATPLSSLRVALTDLTREYAGDDELSPGLTMMLAQTERMKGVLDRLAVAAGGARAQGQSVRPLDLWLTEMVDHWRLMRPGVPVFLQLDGRLPSPVLREDQVLLSVLSTLLNNAADVSAEPIVVEAGWDEHALHVRVLDRGPGLGGAPNKPEGWGVGLSLAQATLQRIQGSLALSKREGGGVVASVEIALAGLRP